MVTISGPRQSGKDHAAQATFPSMPKCFVLPDDSDQREMASGDPEGFLGRFPEGAVIDEAQRCPELFPHLKARVERDRRTGRFVLTGSQQFGLLSRVRQSWAGLAGMQHLLPLSLAELKAAGVPMPDLAGLDAKGLYPPLYDRPLAPQEWYAEYALAYAERELHRVLAVRDLSTFQLFLRMCAARTAPADLSSLASDCGISHNTARSWLSVLEAGYLVFLLRPHMRNFGKRLVKKPRVFPGYRPGRAYAQRAGRRAPGHSSAARRAIRKPGRCRAAESALQPRVAAEPDFLGQPTRGSRSTFCSSKARP